MNPVRIVLIEDSPADVYLIELALKENGIPCELTNFESGLEALGVLCPAEDEAATFVPDAILLDLNTPKSDGFQVLTRLKQSPRLAQVPIAIITSSSAIGDRHRSAMQGVRYIQKPSGLEAFLATVGQAVKDMLYHSASQSG
jgi:CheY-like chemotaxis protein